MAKGAVLTNTVLLLTLIIGSVSAQDTSGQASTTDKDDSIYVDEPVEMIVAEDISAEFVELADMTNVEGISADVDEPVDMADVENVSPLPMINRAQPPTNDDADVASRLGAIVSQVGRRNESAFAPQDNAKLFAGHAVSSMVDEPLHVIPSIYENHQDLPQPEDIPAETTSPGIVEPESIYQSDETGPVFLNGDGSPIDGDFLGYCSQWCGSGFFAGVEGTFLAPLNEANQSVLLSDLVTNTQTSGSTYPGFGAGVRTWLGIQTNGWGVRSRYWHFGDDALNITPTVPINAQPTIHEMFLMTADVVDVELTQRFRIAGFAIDTSFGARYAKMRRNNTVLGYGTVGNGVTLVGIAMGANEIEGTGFTASIGGRKRLCLFCRDQCSTCDGQWNSCDGGHCGGWFSFWNLRGSTLWADSTSSALTQASAVISNGTVAASASSLDKAAASKDHNETVGIVEFQIGLEYQRHLQRLPAIAFLRAGLEYQHWETGNVFAQSSSFAFLQGASPSSFGGRVGANAIATDGDLDLIGFTLGAGLTY